MELFNFNDDQDLSKDFHESKPANFMKSFNLNNDQDDTFDTINKYYE